MSNSLFWQCGNRRTMQRRTGRCLAVALAAGLVIAAAPMAAMAKPIGTISLAGVTSEPVPMGGLNWDAMQPGPQSSFAVTRTPDQASPLFFFRALLGTPATSAQIIVDRKGTVPTTYDLTNVSLTSMSTQTDAKGQLSEVIQLHFDRLSITAGSVSTCWNFATNVPC